MPKICKQPLQKNPFTTYRDPQTGRWIVVKTEEQEKGKEDTST